MALTDGTMLADDLDFIIADLPVSLTAINGTALATAISGTMDQVDKTKENVSEFTGMGSTLDNYESEAVFPTDKFTTVPSARDSVTIGGVVYFVETVEVSQDGVATTLQLRRN